MREVIASEDAEVVVVEPNLPFPPSELQEVDWRSGQVTDADLHVFSCCKLF